MIVKICGVARRADAGEALEAGADFFGVLCEIERSPRSRSAEEIRTLTEGLNDRLAVLTANRDASFLIDLAGSLRPAVMQLHGDEPPEAVERLRAAWDGEVWKALHVSPESEGGASVTDLAKRAAEFHRAGVRRFVIDTAHSAGGVTLLGGTGVKGDWGAARRLVEETGLSFILAGGLTADNVREAAAAVRPDGVDVSSGVERRKGEKDPLLVRRFVSEARTFDFRC